MYTFQGEAPRESFLWSRTLGITLVFWFCQPTSHFVGAHHGRELHLSVPWIIPKAKLDIDNLYKLVLYALIGLLYDDDGQMATTCNTKVLNNVGTCNGTTAVSVYIISDEALEKLSKVNQHA